MFVKGRKEWRDGRREIGGRRKNERGKSRERKTDRERESERIPFTGSLSKYLQ